MTSPQFQLMVRLDPQVTPRMVSPSFARTGTQIQVVERLMNPPFLLHLSSRGASASTMFFWVGNIKTLHIHANKGLFRSIRPGATPRGRPGKAARATGTSRPVGVVPGPQAQLPVRLMPLTS